MWRVRTLAKHEASNGRVRKGFALPDPCIREPARGVLYSIRKHPAHRLAGVDAPDGFGEEGRH